MAAHNFAEGFERAEKALAGVPDRIPVSAQAHEHGLRFSGLAPRGYYYDPGVSWRRSWRSPSITVSTFPSSPTTTTTSRPRPSADVLPIVMEAIELKRRFGRPHAVWMQLGIVNAEAAEEARAGGLTVVMDRCMMAEHLRLAYRT